MIELTLKLDEASGDALYMQLYRYIRGEIMTGHMKADSRLPSIRKLSAHLGISRTPVALAYDQLLAEGYIRSKPRSGLFVEKLDASIYTSRAPFSSRAHATSSPSRAYHAAPEEPVAYDFGYGSIDLTHFPLVKWRKLMNACLLPEHSRLLLYGDFQGDSQLREEISAYLHQIRGVRCSPEQIVIGAGTYHSLDLIFQLLKEEVTCIAAEEAVNDGVKALLEQYYPNCSPLQLQDDGILLEDVYNSKAQAVYVTPSHQFPFGMTMSIAKRMKLLNWAIQQQAYIIENDYDGEFRYIGKPIPSLQSLDEGGRVIYVGTFSRALTPAFRLSYLVLPYSLLERFRNMRHSFDQLASPIFQRTLLLFMQSGDFERHMRRMRRLYHKKHNVLLQSVLQTFGEKVVMIGVGSGLHILLRVLNGMSEDELVRTARLKGVKVYPTSVYALNPQTAAPSTVLLGFGGLAEADIVAGIESLAQAWWDEKQRY